MKIRKAKIADVKTIRELINSYAEEDRMIFRSISDIYENLQMFFVAEQEAQIVGCCALQVLWEGLAEVKSLAVAEGFFGQGIGKQLVTAATEEAKELGIVDLFALTLEPDFFRRLGFDTVDRDTLPMKVWMDCAKCTKQDHCDEIAMIKKI